MILAGFIFMASYSLIFANTIWENSSIRLSNGKYMWAKVTADSSCYNLQAGGVDFELVGTGTNCSDRLHGNWTVYACGLGPFSVNGGVNEVIQAILKRCQ